MNAINSIFKVLSWIITIAIIVYILIAAPIIIGYKPIVILSGSMEPRYPVGCVTYYKESDFNELQVGDAITFESGGALVTHRIVEISPFSKNVVTKGDNNPMEDIEPVESDNIRGKTTVFRIPWLGYYVNIGRAPMTIVIAVQILLIEFILEKLLKKHNRKGSGK